MWKNDWEKKSTSPYLGFFPMGKRKRGIFFVAVQTFTRKIFSIPLKSTHGEEFLRAIGLMLKVKKKKLLYDAWVPHVKDFNFFQDPEFQFTKKILFDGEAALTSAQIKNKIYSQYSIFVHSEAGYSRNLAERAVRGRTKKNLYFF